MTDKHTPGPWRAAFREGRKGLGDYANILAADDVAIAKTYFNSRSGPANASLIAESPALLAACESIVACISDCESCDATGIEIGTKADACWSCGGVGQVLSGDDIFAAFEARDAIAKIKRNNR